MEFQKQPIWPTDTVDRSVPRSPSVPNSQPVTDRRSFLRGSVLSVAGLSVAAATLLSSQLHGADASGSQVNGEPVALLAKNEHDLFRVRIEMDTKGNVNVPENPLVSRKSKQTLPIESDAVFDYEERYRRPVDADPSSIVTAAERFFHEARQTSQLNRSHHQTDLRDKIPLRQALDLAF